MTSDDDLRHELAALRAEIAALRADLHGSATVRRERRLTRRQRRREQPPTEAISRRNLLRHAPIVAAGLLSATTMAQTSPAVASPEQNLVLGSDNSAQATTSLTATGGAEPALDISGGVWVHGDLVADTFAIRPDAGSMLDPGAVTMLSGIDDPQVLVRGATETAGPDGSRGNVGLSVDARLASAIQATSEVCGLETQVAGDGAGILSRSESGPALVATSSDIGTHAATVAVDHHGQGSGLVATIHGGGNTRPAIAARHQGAGAAISGVSSTGRGGQFQGRAAPLRLVPGTRLTHPVDGATGDFYVDRSGRLWFCTNGIVSPGVWIRLG